MQENKVTILCALCGRKFIPDSGSICPACTLKSMEDKRMLAGDDINYCRYCERFERPPWINCERQSQELLSILLKKVKGLNKVKFLNASFIWTEPHSKRMKIKVNYEHQFNDKMKVEMMEVVQFVEKYGQCPDCKKKFTPHDWVALVQVRQHVSHKRTIHAMEQLLLRQKMGDKIMKTEEVDSGIDFFFSHETDALRFADFFKSRLPISCKSSKQFISHNEQNNTSVVKVTYSIIIPKICKDDLVRIPRKLSKQLGSCCQLLLCTKVSSYINLIDVRTLKKVQITSTQYFLYEGLIEIYRLKFYGKKFTILDTELLKKNNKFVGGFGVTFMKEDQFKEIYTICHFEEEAGTDVLGFDVVSMDQFEDIKDVPDFILVKRIRDAEEKKKQRAAKRKREAIKRKEQALSQMPQQQPKSDEDLSDADEWESLEEAPVEELPLPVKEQQ